MLKIIICDDDIIERDYILNILQKIFLVQNIDCEIKCFALLNNMIINKVEKADICILNISDQIQGISLGKK